MLAKENCKSTENDGLKPAFEKSDVVVCLSCSNEYTPFACVTIASIAANSSKDNKYDIVILNTDITEVNQQYIREVIKDFSNVSVRFFNVEKFIGEKTFYTWAHFTKFTYYRLLVPDVFSEFEKVIYLDSDIIVNHDIAELYKINLEGWLLGAAIDTHVVGRLQQRPCHESRSYYVETLGITDDISYYQCGVSLYNIAEFKKNFETGQLIKEASEARYRWLDQDFMNVKASGKIKRISNKWNVMIFNTPTSIDEYNLLEEEKNNYFEARQDPYIIHYVGRGAPCFCPGGDFHCLYWKYARQTPFYEYLVQLHSVIKNSILLQYVETRAEAWCSAIYQRIQREKKLQWKLKNEIIMPLVNKFLPKESKRRKMVKKILRRR